jgi:hypothetical protein
MHRQPAILPIAPDMVGQTEDQRWGTRCATLTPALVRHHTVVEPDHEPDLPSGARVAPGQTPRATPQGRHEPAPGAIPAFHTGGLERLPALPEAPLRAKTARPTADDTPAHRHPMARLIADLHDLRIGPVFGGHEPWLGLAAHFPVTSRTIDPPHDLQQRRRRGLPPVCQPEWERLSASDDRRDERGRRVWGPRSAVAPQEAPTPPY